MKPSTRTLLSTAAALSTIILGATSASATELPQNAYASNSRVEATAKPALNPVTIGLCNAGLGNTVVKKWKSANDGDIRLYCGDAASGYVHIRKDHKGQWEDRVKNLGGKWDDLMAFATEQALKSPKKTRPKSGNKRCYTTPVQLRDSRNVVRVTFNPTIIISLNNKKVITSYPSSKDACGK